MIPRAVGWVAIAAVSMWCCSDSTVISSSTLGASGVLVLAPQDGDALTDQLVQSTTVYLTELLGAAPAVRKLPNGHLEAILEVAEQQAAGFVWVVQAEYLAENRVNNARLAALGESGFVLETSEHGNWHNAMGTTGATVLLTAGATKLSEQYAIYEALRRMGVRFFHPEQEYVPTLTASQLRELATQPTILHREGQDYLPDFPFRSWSFHGAHPLEILESFSDADHPLGEALRLNQWVVKNFGNRFQSAGRGVSSATKREQRLLELEELRLQLGFSDTTGLSLHNEQQGANAEIDRASGQTARQQIEDLVAQKLKDKPKATLFSINFGPTELTVTPDQETVNWLNWAGQKALELRPDIAVEINAHISGGQPMENYGDLGCPSGTSETGRSDYYDLSFHTDPRLGVRVHTVMFYPLEGAARVYNQQSFAHKLCLMKKASTEGRPLSWFPEGSWWLNFDNAIPVYLPLYTGSRGRDVEMLKTLLPAQGGTLQEHRMFTSGQEWGYWQQDYAVGLWGFNADLSLTQILGDIFDPLCAPKLLGDSCEARDTAIDVLRDMIEHQRVFFLERADYQGRVGGLYAYFAGDDEADQIASASGLEFRPVRVPFENVIGWSEEALLAFEASDMAALREAREAYGQWLERLRGIAPNVPKSASSWLEEVMDGVEINELRARQAHSLYSTIIALSRQRQQVGMQVESEALEQWELAQATLAGAEAVIARRESSYRYPAAQSWGGGLTDDTAIENGTTYQYRVQTKTHLLTYWHNRNEQVKTLLGSLASGPRRSVSLLDAIALPEQSVTLSWPEMLGTTGSISIAGDKLTTSNNSYQPQGSGYWPVVGEVVVSGEVLSIRGGLVRTESLLKTPPAGLVLQEPSNELARSVLSGVFPAIKWGWLAGESILALAADPQNDGLVEFDAVVAPRIVVEQSGAFASERFAMTLPVAASSGGRSLTIEFLQTQLSGTMDSAGPQEPIAITAQVALNDVVALLQELAGFDEMGALQTLAGLLEFDANQPPETIGLVGELAIASFGATKD